MNIFCFVLIYLAECLVAQLDNDTFDSDESERIKETNALYNELFTTRNYNRYFYPFNKRSTENLTTNHKKLSVHFDLFYIKLLALDAESQLLSANVELKMYWRDPRLVWDPIKFNGTDHIFVSTEILWVPDSQIGNAKTLDSIKAGETVRTAQIFSNGTIYLPVFYYTEVACPIIINTFPFDKQLCPIPMMSMVFDETYIVLSAGIDPFLFQLTEMATAITLAQSPQDANELFGVMFSKQFLSWGNGEWDVTNISSLSSTQAGMTMVAFLLNIKRVPNFYVYVIATPCFILTTLSIVGMFWTPNIKKEQLVKLTIGLTSLVSMTVLLQMLSDAIPKTSVFPLLGIYVVCCVGIISFASVIITLHCLPNPKKEHYHQKSVDELHQKEDLETSNFNSINSLRVSIVRFIRSMLHRHSIFLLFFQILNLIGFIVFLSYWD